jgi:hypothetical protein
MPLLANLDNRRRKSYKERMQERGQKRLRVLNFFGWFKIFMFISADS